MRLYSFFYTRLLNGSSHEKSPPHRLSLEISLKDSDCQQNEFPLLNIWKELCELDSAVCNKY